MSAPGIGLEPIRLRLSTMDSVKAPGHRVIVACVRAYGAGDHRAGVRTDMQPEVETLFAVIDYQRGKYV